MFFSNSNMFRTQRYIERRIVGYSQSQMFNIVANVADYKKFVPFVLESTSTFTLQNNAAKATSQPMPYTASSVTYKQPAIAGINSPSLKSSAKLVVGYQSLTEQYTSQLQIRPPSMVIAESHSSIFSKLKSTWKIDTYRQHNVCIVDFAVEFEFKSIVHAQMSNLVKDRIARMMVDAFEQRALILHGKPSRESRVLEVDSK
jgi:coenzyme Q-binding protein COQ10